MRKWLCDVIEKFGLSAVRPKYGAPNDLSILISLGAGGPPVLWIHSFHYSGPTPDPERVHITIANSPKSSADYTLYKKWKADCPAGFIEREENIVLGSVPKQLRKKSRTLWRKDNWVPVIYRSAVNMVPGLVLHQLADVLSSLD
jgi:hypothetical protein